MKIFNSYRIQVFFLLASIIVGIYTIISISDSSESAGSVFNANGLIIKENSGDEPFDGKITDTLTNKIISYDVKNGLKNGEFTIFFLDGKKEISGKMSNNKNDGKWYYYYPSGKLETEGHFKNDVVVDKWIWYYQNGNIKEEGLFDEGKREGVWKLYNEDGSLKSSMYFNKGNIVSSFNTKAPVAS